MRRILKVATPENVHLEYVLAGLGSRFAALIIDSLIQGMLILVVLIGVMLGGISFDGMQQVDSVIVAVGISGIFMIVFGYFVFFDMVMNGQSPGKKFFGLRVVRQNGQNIGFMDSFLRNILRLADFLPLINFAGAFFILLTPMFKRIGDYAAHTVVVKTHKIESIMKLAFNENSSWDGEQIQNIYPVNALEYSVLRQFLARRGKLGDRQNVFLFHLNRYFMEKFNIKPINSDPYEFLGQILKMNSGIR